MLFLSGYNLEGVEYVRKWNNESEENKNVRITCKYCRQSPSHEEHTTHIWWRSVEVNRRKAYATVSDVAWEKGGGEREMDRKEYAKGKARGVEREIEREREKNKNPREKQKKNEIESKLTAKVPHSYHRQPTN